MARGTTGRERPMDPTDKTETVYLQDSGPSGTESAVAAGLARAARLGLGDIVVASSTGATARHVLAALAGVSPRVNLVVVSHHVGFHEPGQDEMSPQTRLDLEAGGARILTTTHLLGGVERAVSRQYGGLYPGGIIAGALRLFGEGTKVAVEIAVMALDAGLIPFGRDVLSLGGAGRGADTALVVRPSHARSFFETRVVEIVCRPYPKR